MSGEATSYLGLIAALRQRLTVELGLSYETIDALMGWAPTFTTKVLAPEPIPKPRINGKRVSTVRALSPSAFDGLLRLACWRIVFVEDEKAREWLLRHRDYVPRKRPVLASSKHTHVVHRKTATDMRFMQIAGGHARARKLSKKRRGEIAKKAARMRWSKPQLVEITPQPAQQKRVR